MEQRTFAVLFKPLRAFALGQDGLELVKRASTSLDALREELVHEYGDEIITFSAEETAIQ